MNHALWRAIMLTTESSYSYERGAVAIMQPDFTSAYGLYDKFIPVLTEPFGQCIFFL